MFIQTSIAQAGPPALDRKVGRHSLYYIKAHQALAHEGEPQHYVHHLSEGWACRYKLLPDGRRQITALFLPGNFCELGWACDAAAAQHVVALTNVRTVRLSCRDLRQKAAADPELYAFLWSDMQASAAMQTEWIVNLGRKSALEKLSHLFCELHYRLKAARLTCGDQYAMPLTQLELADITGLTPVHVNRTLQEMRTLGLIELRSRWLRIPDLERLRQLALFDGRYLHWEARDNDRPKAAQPAEKRLLAS
jgi:CRP-like cAMP-binding protein